MTKNTMSTSRRFVLMLLVLELAIGAVGGVITLIATHDGQTCETTANSCGVSGFVSAAWGAALIMVPCVVITLIVFLVLGLLQKDTHENLHRRRS